MKMKGVIYALTLFFGLITGIQVEASSYKVSTMTELTNAVKKSLSNFDSSYTIVYTGDTNTFKNNIKSVTTNVTKADPVLQGYFQSQTYSYSIRGNEATVKFNVKYNATKKQAAAANTNLKKIAKSLSSNKTDFDKVKAVNDYIVKNAAYGGTSQTKFTPVGIFIDKKAVCQGYALAAYQLLKELKVDVQLVTGKANNTSHAWNKVKVDGKWYNLDVTWNDPTPNKPNQVSYNYFLVSDTVLAKDHSWNASSTVKATDTKYNFYADATYAAKVGDTIYYSNKADNNKLYKFTLKTKKKVKLSNARAFYITYTNNKLYYSDYANGGYLTSANLSGKVLKVHNKKKSDYLSLNGSKLTYYINNKLSTLSSL